MDMERDRERLIEDLKWNVGRLERELESVRGEIRVLWSNLYDVALVAGGVPVDRLLRRS